MSTLQELATQALEQAIAMNKFAESKEWDQLEQLQTQHSALIQKINTAEIPTDNQDIIRDMLIQVQELNSSTSELAGLFQDELIEAQKTQKKVVKMQKALNDLKID
ncbi:hypothetical protein [Neptuniibacter sp. QD48_11]|uniref:hypothetical protein n=1 Tax=unclassified Neptuniibacter TaxID=2630693 RepID=UPI0039F5905E